MIPAQFEYAAPTTLNEALAALSNDPEAKALAGGHSLLPMMKLRLAAPTQLIDLRNIAELRGVSAQGGGWRIGALTTYDQIAKNASLAGYQALIDATSVIGDTQVRNRGTIGGSLAHADPAADLPAVVLVLEATHQRHRLGRRHLAADRQLLHRPVRDRPGAGRDHHARWICRRWPQAPAATYAKQANPASGYAMVGVAARVTLSGGVAQNVRVALTGAADHATRLTSVEQALEGQATHRREHRRRERERRREGSTCWATSTPRPSTAPR